MPDVWTDELLTGVTEIDRQHREWFTHLGALDAAIQSGSVRQALYTLEYLERYSVEHFASELRYMRAIGYPKHDEHRAAHEAFVAEFVERKRAHARNRSLVALTAGLWVWLGAWQRSHLRGADAELARFLSNPPHS